MAKKKARRVPSTTNKQTLTPKPPADHGTPELQEKRKRHITQTPLDYYYLGRKFITERQYLAGMKLYSDFHYSGIYPSSSPAEAPMSPGSSPASTSMSERQVQARERLRKALASIQSPTSRMIAENVCCYGFFLRELTIKYYDHPQTLMPPLKEALEVLGNFYGLPAD